MSYEIQSKSDFLTGVSLIVRIPESELDHKAMNTIQADLPEFILPFRHKSVDGQAEFTYHTGSHSKLQYLSGERMLKDYAGLWSSIISPLLDCGDWFMNPYSFVLSAEYLYYDKNRNTLCYVYIPSTRRYSGYSALKEMAAEVTRIISVADPDFENRVLRAIMKDFNPNDFLQMLKSYIASNASASNARAASAPAAAHWQEPPQTQCMYLPAPIPAAAPTTAPSPGQWAAATEVTEGYKPPAAREETRGAQQYSPTSEQSGSKIFDKAPPALAASGAPGFSGAPVVAAIPGFTGPPLNNRTPVTNGVQGFTSASINNGTPVTNGAPAFAGAPVNNGAPLAAGAATAPGAPVAPGVSGDIVISMPANGKPAKKTREKPKGKEPAGDKKVKKQKQPTGVTGFLNQQWAEQQEVFRDTLSMPQLVRDPNNSALNGCSTSTDCIEITQSTTQEAGGARLRLVGSAILPQSIDVRIAPGEIFTVGRFDAAIGKKQSSFEFDKKTKAVSRRHAVIERRAEGYSVIDLSSSAGTFLNGNKLPPNTPRELASGSRVSFGNAGADYVWEEN